MVKLRVVLLVVMQIELYVQGKSYIIRRDDLVDCEYRGYIPGGSVTSVGKIEAPVAKLAKSGIASVLGPASQASTLAMHSLNTVKAIMNVFTKVAPKLGPVLGVFGAVTGIFKGLTEVKPKDIMGAVNQAMGELTKDINDKMERMEGYVDSKIITLEKNLIQREYRVAFNLWTGCAREASVELSNECQREAYSTLSANRPKFAVFAQKLFADDENKFPITSFEARELEAYLPAFREYANLLLMMLKPLIETYAEDDSEVGKRHYERYSEALTDQAQWFAKYSKRAVKAILWSHIGPGRDGVCRDTVDCGPAKTIKEGFFKKHTADGSQCTCIIEEGTKQAGTRKMTFRKDGKHPSGYISYNYGNCNEYTCAAKEYTTRVLVPESKKYVKKNHKVALAYWRKELLDFIPVWRDAVEEINKEASRRSDTENESSSADGSGDDDDDGLDQNNDFEYSERHKKRLEEAEKTKWTWDQ
jgi:hypothetical protein